VSESKALPRAPGCDTGMTYSDAERILWGRVMDSPHDGQAAKCGTVGCQVATVNVDGFCGDCHSSRYAERDVLIERAAA
jgi:hypothetical protein